MTMPTERTRALRWAGEFLQDMASSPAVSEATRNEATRILRHYPSSQDIQRAAQYLFVKPVIRGPWLRPEGTEQKVSVRQTHLDRKRFSVLFY
jgi:hypothetical protein